MKLKMKKKLEMKIKMKLKHFASGEFLSLLVHFYLCFSFTWCPLFLSLFIVSFCLSLPRYVRLAFRLSLLLSLSLFLFKKWFPPWGKVFHLLVVVLSWPVVMFEKHVCGHSLGDQSHDRVLHEFLWWSFISARNLLCQLGILSDYLCDFVSQDFVLAVFLLDVVEEQILDLYWLLSWRAFPASVSSGIFW